MEYYTFEFFEQGDGWIEIEAEFDTAEIARFYGKNLIAPVDRWRVKRHTVTRTEEVVLSSEVST